MDLTAAIDAIDAAHAADPEREDGRPAELVYAERMSAWAARVWPEPPPALQLAARCQHLERWTLPRAGFPQDRAGYLRWRTALYRQQAERARALLLAAGVEPAVVGDVAALVAKEELKTNPLSQALEDAACLVFLAHELPGFAASHADYPRAKWLDILRKTWRKMGARGRELAGELAATLPEPFKSLVTEAVAAA